MPIKQETLADFGVRNITQYATEVNLDRAIPELYDGLKPVLRRAAWSAHQFHSGEAVKSAKIVGQCIGSYHPHGDSSVYGAMQTMVHHNVPLLAGVGNWGTIIDPAAAYRYCFTSSTRVMTERGLVTMGELAKLSNIDSDNVEYETDVDTKNGVEKTSHFVNSGIQEVVKVTTDRGYEVTCTPNEPFYVMRESGYHWVEAQDLKPNDWLCLKRRTNLNVIGNHKLPNAYAKFLGYMIGSGKINKNHIEFSHTDQSVFYDFLNSACTVLNKYRSDARLKKCEEPRTYYELDSAEARLELAKLGLSESNDCVPELVFHGNPTFVASFLSALFESSCTQYESESSSAIALSLNSKKLLADIDLLLRTYFGIFSTFTTDDLFPSLSITGTQNIYLFRLYIGFCSEGKNARIHVDESVLYGTSTERLIEDDCIPFSKELKLSKYSRTYRNTFRHKVESGDLKSDFAKLIYDRDYYYCRVLSVKDAGEEQVWDLTVPKTHSFVANGFIVHNTNCLLNKFGNSVFDPNYKAVMDTVPNFDNSTIEPVVLPVRLPLLVLNGGEGIGVGITASIPTFTLESVIEVLTSLFSGKKLTPNDYAKILKPKQHWGGHLVKSEQNKKAWLELMETGRAKIQFEPTLEVDEAKKTITISEWPAGLNPVKFIQKVRQIPEVQRAQNSKGSMTFTIEIKKGYNVTQFQALVAKVRKLSIAAESYRLNVTHRVSKTEDGVTTYDTKFLALSVPEFFEAWCRLRLGLEKRSLTYQMAKQQEAIDYHELLIYAADNLQVVFKALKQKDSRQYLMTNLKLTEKQADQILDLKVRNLSRLDQSQLKAKLKALKARMKELQGFYKKPKTKIKSEFPQLLGLIEEDQKAQNKRDNQELVVR